MAKEESRETDITSHIKEYIDKYSGILVYPLSRRPNKNCIWDSKSCEWIDYQSEEQYEKECKKRLLGEIIPDAKALRRYLVRQLERKEGKT